MCSFLSVSVGKKLQLYWCVFWWRWWQSRCPGYVTGRSPGGGKLAAQLVGRVLLQRTSLQTKPRWISPVRQSWICFDTAIIFVGSVRG